MSNQVHGLEMFKLGSLWSQRLVGCTQLLLVQHDQDYYCNCIIQSGRICFANLKKRYSELLAVLCQCRATVFSTGSVAERTRGCQREWTPHTFSLAARQTKRHDWNIGPKFKQSTKQINDTAIINGDLIGFICDPCLRAQSSTSPEKILQLISNFQVINH